MRLAELDRTPVRRRPAAGPGDAVRLDPSRPLRVATAAGGPTTAVVSIAWLHRQEPAVAAAIGRRHLHPDEADSMAALPAGRRRTEWLAGRIAVKHAVRGHRRQLAGRPVDPADIRVRVVPGGIRQGKPEVDGPVEVGLAHSADFAVAACGPGPLGIDLERSRQMAPLAGLLAVGADGTRDPVRRRLRAMPLSLRWACKEAVLKYAGVGLRIDTRQVELTGWYADGRFRWQVGPELSRHLPAGGDGTAVGWAREVDGYSLALVWE